MSPASFRHFGIAYGARHRRQPPRAAVAARCSFRSSSGVSRARRGARDADLVHAHWLPSGAVAATLRKPFVVQVWGTDVELARRVPVARAADPAPGAARARGVAGRSRDEARALGARDVRVVPTRRRDPASGRASRRSRRTCSTSGGSRAEKGVLELVEACAGLPLVVVGDGPLRSRVPGAVGLRPAGGARRLYERAAVVACPSRREGYGVVARQAMA